MAQVLDIDQWRRPGPVESPPDQPDPGLVWEPDVPGERASALLTMRDLLATWRSAERFLEGMPPGDPASALVAEQITSLRAAYHRLFLQIRRGSTAR